MQERNPFLFCPVLEQQSLHGFAPSATISIRSEERLMSLWSRCATNAQCMSLDFTQATFAAATMRNDWHTTEKLDSCVIDLHFWFWLSRKLLYILVPYLCIDRLFVSMTEDSLSLRSMEYLWHASCSWHSEIKKIKGFYKKLVATTHIMLWAEASIQITLCLFYCQCWPSSFPI